MDKYRQYINPYYKPNKYVVGGAVAGAPQFGSQGWQNFMQNINSMQGAGWLANQPWTQNQQGIQIMGQMINQNPLLGTTQPTEQPVQVPDNSASVDASSGASGGLGNTLQQGATWLGNAKDALGVLGKGNFSGAGPAAIVTGAMNIASGWANNNMSTEDKIANTTREVGYTALNFVPAVGPALSVAARLADKVGGEVQKALSNGYSSDLDNKIKGVTKFIPVAQLGAVAIAGSLYNRVMGSKINQEKVNEIEASNDKIGSQTSLGTTTGTLMSDFSNMDWGKDFTKSDVGKDASGKVLGIKMFKGGNKAQKKFESLQAQQEQARNSAARAFTARTEEVGRRNAQQGLMNYMAIGGPTKGSQTQTGSKKTSWAEGHAYEWANFLQSKGYSPEHAYRLSQLLTVQDSLESNNGTSRYARELNNYGGMEIKGKDGKKKGVRYRDKNHYFEAKYSMLNRKFKGWDTGDSEEFLSALIDGQYKYATDPRYKQKMRSMFKNKNIKTQQYSINEAKKATELPYGDISIPDNTYVAPQPQLDPVDMEAIKTKVQLPELIESKDNTPFDLLTKGKQTKSVFSSPVLSNEDVNQLTPQTLDFMRSYERMLNPFGSSYADGGLLFNNGSEFQNGLTYINKGGTHEDNPNQGIAVSMDDEGNPNLVEEGEVILDGNYVMSDRLKVPDTLAKNLGVPKGFSFAKALRRLAKESEELPNDPIVKRGLRANEMKLVQAQEQIRDLKQEMDNLHQHCYGGKLLANGGNLYAIGGPDGEGDWDPEQPIYTIQDPRIYGNIGPVVPTQLLSHVITEDEANSRFRKASGSDHVWFDDSGKSAGAVRYDPDNFDENYIVPGMVKLPEVKIVGQRIQNPADNIMNRSFSNFISPIKEMSANVLKGFLNPDFIKEQRYKSGQMNPEEKEAYEIQMMIKDSDKHKQDQFVENHPAISKITKVLNYVQDPIGSALYDITGNENLAAVGSFVSGFLGGKGNKIGKNGKFSNRATEKAFQQTKNKSGEYIVDGVKYDTPEAGRLAYQKKLNGQSENGAANTQTPQTSTQEVVQESVSSPSNVEYYNYPDLIRPLWNRAGNKVKRLNKWSTEDKNTYTSWRTGKGQKDQSELYKIERRNIVEDSKNKIVKSQEDYANYRKELNAAKTESEKGKIQTAFKDNHPEYMNNGKLMSEGEVVQAIKNTLNQSKKQLKTETTTFMSRHPGIAKFTGYTPMGLEVAGILGALGTYAYQNTGERAREKQNNDLGYERIPGIDDEVYQKQEGDVMYFVDKNGNSAGYFNTKTGEIGSGGKRIIYDNQTPKSTDTPNVSFAEYLQSLSNNIKKNTVQSKEDSKQQNSQSRENNTFKSDVIPENIEDNQVVRKYIIDPEDEGSWYKFGGNLFNGGGEPVKGNWNDNWDLQSTLDYINAYNKNNYVGRNQGISKVNRKDISDKGWDAYINRRNNTNFSGLSDFMYNKDNWTNENADKIKSIISAIDQNQNWRGQGKYKDYRFFKDDGSYSDDAYDVLHKMREDDNYGLFSTFTVNDKQLGQLDSNQDVGPNIDKPEGWFHQMGDSEPEYFESEKALLDKYPDASKYFDADESDKEGFYNPEHAEKYKKAHYYHTSTPDQTTVKEPQQQKTKEQLPPDKASALAYAPAVGALAMYAQNAAEGPDYSFADKYDRLAGQEGRPISIPVDVIGNYRKKNPFDERYLVNMNNQNANAFARTGQNVSGGNRAMQMGMASIGNFQRQQNEGEIMRQAYEANRKDDADVETFNRATDMFNAQAGNQRNIYQASINSQRDLKANEDRLKGILMRQGIKDKYDTVQSGLLNSMFDNLGNIGFDARSWNQYANLYNHGATGFAQDKTGYTTAEKQENIKQNAGKAYGGKIKSKKKKRRF